MRFGCSCHARRALCSPDKRRRQNLWACSRCSQGRSIVPIGVQGPHRATRAIARIPPCNTPSRRITTFSILAARGFEAAGEAAQLTARVKALPDRRECRSRRCRRDAESAGGRWRSTNANPTPASRTPIDARRSKRPQVSLPVGRPTTGARSGETERADQKRLAYSLTPGTIKRCPFKPFTMHMMCRTMTPSQITPPSSTPMIAERKEVPGLIRRPSSNPERDDQGPSPPPSGPDRASRAIALRCHSFRPVAGIRANSQGTTARS